MAEVGGEWTLGELVERASRALAAADVQAPNGRVTPMPDARVIRWYATIGLVDRPVAMRGRTAVYGPRHLLQLVAVKRRQAQGRTLAEIQAELTGATDATLRRIARLPDDATAEAAGTEAAGTAEVAGTADDRLAVVNRAPAEEGAFRGGSAGGRAGSARGRAGSARRRFWTQAPTVSEVLSGVRLGGGAVLLLPATPDAADLAEIASAARPLLDLLTARGLLHDGDR